MQRPLEQLEPAVLRDAVDSAQNALFQEIASSRTPNTLQRAGIPTQGRVLVAIAFQGCTSHQFPELEAKARQQNATLYIINGQSLTLGSGAIQVGNRRLDGVVRSHLSPNAVLQVANELGLHAYIHDAGVGKQVISTGSLLIVNGQIARRYTAADMEKTPERRGFERA